MAKIDYPPAILKGNGEIKVLYEKCYNIESLLLDLKERFEDHDKWGSKCQADNQKKFGELEERTVTTKQVVWGSLLIALSALATVIVSFVS